MPQGKIIPPIPTIQNPDEEATESFQAVEQTNQFPSNQAEESDSSDQESSNTSTDNTKTNDFTSRDFTR